MGWSGESCSFITPASVSSTSIGSDNPFTTLINDPPKIYPNKLVVSWIFNTLTEKYFIQSQAMCSLANSPHILDPDGCLYPMFKLRNRKHAALNSTCTCFTFFFILTLGLHCRYFKAREISGRRLLGSSSMAGFRTISLLPSVAQWNNQCMQTVPVMVCWCQKTIPVMV